MISHLISLVKSIPSKDKFLSLNFEVVHYFSSQHKIVHLNLMPSLNKFKKKLILIYVIIMVNYLKKIISVQKMIIFVVKVLMKLNSVYFGPIIITH